MCGCLIFFISQFFPGDLCLLLSSSLHQPFCLVKQMASLHRKGPQQSRQGRRLSWGPWSPYNLKNFLLFFCHCSDCQPHPSEAKTFVNYVQSLSSQALNKYDEVKIVVLQQQCTYNVVAFPIHNVENMANFSANMILMITKTGNNDINLENNRFFSL